LKTGAVMKVFLIAILMVTCVGLSSLFRTYQNFKGMRMPVVRALPTRKFLPGSHDWLR